MMRGSNSTECPICHNLREEWRNGIGYLYGTLSYKEFKEVETEYEDAMLIQTVKEDWVIGLENDGLSINYSAKCDNCCATWHYSKTGIHKN